MECHRCGLSRFRHFCLSAILNTYAPGHGMVYDMDISSTFDNHSVHINSILKYFFFINSRYVKCQSLPNWNFICGNICFVVANYPQRLYPDAKCVLNSEENRFHLPSFRNARCDSPPISFSPFPSIIHLPRFVCVLYLIEETYMRWDSFSNMEEKLFVFL